MIFTSIIVDHRIYALLIIVQYSNTLDIFPYLFFYWSFLLLFPFLTNRPNHSLTEQSHGPRCHLYLAVASYNLKQKHQQLNKAEILNTSTPF